MTKKEPKLKKEFVYEVPQKPVMDDIKTISPDTQEFSEPDKATAIIRYLKLPTGSTIRESDNGEDYTINPRQVLSGTSPAQYEQDIRNVRAILTSNEVTAMNKAISQRRKEYDNQLYDRIDTRVMRFYANGKIKRSVKQEIREALESLKEGHSAGLSNIIFHLLSKGEDEQKDFVVCYRAAWKGQPVPDTRTWHEENDGEYRVLTDSEADQAFDDYFDGDYLWRQAVESETTTLGYDDWVEMVKSNDGLRSCLSGYDGEEQEEEVNGTMFYIYRTN